MVTKGTRTCIEEPEEPEDPSRKRIAILTVTTPTVISERFDGSVFVERGGVVEVSGLIEHDLVIEPGGRCVLTGMVGGWVLNRGGMIDIKGAVSLGFIEVSGKTTIHRGAVIVGRRY